MKKRMIKPCSVALALTMLMSMPIYTTSNAVEVSESNDIHIEMVEDENGIRLIGPTDDSPTETESSLESATVIDSVIDYYELTRQNSEQSKYKRLFKSGTLPDSVDNSDTEYFPAIDNQGSIGSCVSWA